MSKKNDNLDVLVLLLTTLVTEISLLLFFVVSISSTEA